MQIEELRDDIKSISDEVLKILGDKNIDIGEVLDILTHCTCLVIAPNSVENSKVESVKFAEKYCFHLRKNIIKFTDKLRDILNEKKH